MAIDNTKLNYLSTWDIDQLYATNTVAVGLGTSLLYTFPSDLPVLPEFEVQYKPSGDTKWYQSGTYSTAGTVATSTVFFVFVSAGALYIIPSAGAGTARYFVWTDKVNY